MPDQDQSIPSHNYPHKGQNRDTEDLTSKRDASLEEKEQKSLENSKPDTLDTSQQDPKLVIYPVSFFSKTNGAPGNMEWPR